MMTRRASDFRLDYSLSKYCKQDISEVRVRGECVLAQHCCKYCKQDISEVRVRGECVLGDACASRFSEIGDSVQAFVLIHW